jgi:hypothetical protein
MFLLLIECFYFLKTMITEGKDFNYQKSTGMNKKGGEGGKMSGFFVYERASAVMNPCGARWMAPGN